MVQKDNFKRVAPLIFIFGGLLETDGCPTFFLSTYA